MPDPIQAKGANSSMIYGLCSAFGALPGTPEGLVLYRKGGESFAGDVEQIKSDIMRNNRNPMEPTDGNIKQGGGFQFDLAWQYALFFRHLLGGYTPADAVGGVYTEVFKVGNIPAAGLWFEKGFPDLAAPQFIQSVGHKINKFSYEMKPSGYLGCSFDIPGANELTPTGASVDATPIDLGLDAFNAKIATVEFNGTAIGNVSSAKFDFDNTMDTGNYCLNGGGAIRSISEGEVNLSGSLSYLFEDSSLYDLAVAGSIVNLKFDHLLGLGDGTAGNERMTIELPEIKLEKKTPTIKDAKGVVGEAPFTGFYKNDAAASCMVITVKHASAVLHGLLV
ncbi:MAG: phage tail tube protein [Desulfuromonadaceae bacterium]|nr:phage tail tube protein [Desulfuromonadaceae bacterium]MDD2855325.1 phage tail tube protein [Desulfuromonadaceae bacterium]